MKYGIALFIYDRPQCTKKVLEALKRNHIEELFVFQDGLGERTNRAGWEQNADIIKKIDWCNVHYEKNKQKAHCLDEQIVYGINQVFEQKEEIIVIEDDCVVSDDCIGFFGKCFDTYRENKKVISIDAYLEPIDVPKDYQLSVIAAGTPSSWGWGTWKDRWEEFQRDFTIIKRIGNSMKNYRVFDSCGYPIKKILTDYWLLGTWDLWWSMFVLIKEGIAIRPVYNKVYNIGFENPGTHTSGESPWIIPISDKADAAGNYPLELEIEPWAEKEFKKFYQQVSAGTPFEERQTYYRSCLEKWLEYKQKGKHVADALLHKNISRVAIYGTGTIGKLLIGDLKEKIDIVSFVVTTKEADNFLGYPIYGFDEKQQEDTHKLALIVIPGYDIEKIKASVGKQFLKCIPLETLFEEQNL